MSFSELKAFDAVARHGSFVKAADELCRTQPTITMQVSQLEHAYGVELIIRNKGRVKGLSHLGQQLYEITRTIFTLEQDAETLLTDAGKLVHGQIHIIGTAHLMVLSLIKELKKEFPNINCQMQFANSEEVLKHILECRADFGILGGKVTHSDCIAVPIAKPEIILIGPKHFKTDTKGVLSRKEFAKQTLLIREPGSETRELLLKKAKQHNYKPANFMEINSRSATITGARDGMGFAAVSEHEIEPSDGFGVYRLKDFRVYGVNHAVCLVNRSKNKLLQVLLKKCKEMNASDL